MRSEKSRLWTAVVRSSIVAVLAAALIPSVRAQESPTEGGATNSEVFSQESEQRDNEPPNRRDVPRNDERWYDDAKELPNLGEVKPQLKAHFAARFGWTWINRDVSPSRLMVGVVDPTTEDRSAVAEITDGDTRTDVVAVRYSASAVAEFRTKIEPIMFRGPCSCLVGPDHRSGRVLIRVEKPLDETTKAEMAASGVPEDAYVVEVLPGGGGGTNVHATRQTYPPYEGGLQVDIVPPGGGVFVSCTSWFTTRNNFGAQTPKGVTAGHCEEVGASSAYMGGTNLGTLGGNTYRGQTSTQSDAVRLPIPVSSLTNRIYVGSNAHRTVKYPKYLVSELDPGLGLCFQGITSGANNCGDITLSDFSATDEDGVLHTRLWEINFDSEQGDSGGPVYGVRADGTAKVAGIVSQNSDANGNMRFHAAAFVLSDLSVDIYYG